MFLSQVFNEIRNEHFSQVFGFLSQKARNLQTAYDVSVSFWPYLHLYGPLCFQLICLPLFARYGKLIDSTFIIYNNAPLVKCCPAWMHNICLKCPLRTFFTSKSRSSCLTIIHLSPSRSLQKRSGMDIKQMKTFVSEELKGLKQEHRLLSLREYWVSTSPESDELVETIFMSVCILKEVVNWC